MITRRNFTAGAATLLAAEPHLDPRASGDGELGHVDGMARRQFPHAERVCLRRGGEEGDAAARSRST